MDFHYNIYIYIYISCCIYIYIFLIIIILGPLLDYLGRVSTSGLRSGALYNLRIVRDVCRGFPLRILPSLDAREPLSLFPFPYLMAAPPLLTLFIILVFARLAASLATKTDDPTARDLLSRCLSRSSRASSASGIMPASSFFASRLANALYVCVSRRLLSFIAVVGPENLMRADAFAPPAPLRVTGICKSIYL